MSHSGKVATVGLAALLSCSGGKKHVMTSQEMIAADPLPLAKGAKWTYDVTVKRYDADTDKETTKKLTWTTEVIDQKDGDGVTAYRVRGWLTDLDDFDQAPVASEKTLLRSGNKFLWGATQEPTLFKAECWFTWPVFDGQRVCESNESVYYWRATAVETGYALSYVTGPDEETFELEPGTGVSRFHYQHHGTTNEVEAKLVTYTKGR
jgi:hypothetical protein